MKLFEALNQYTESVKDLSKKNDSQSYKDVIEQIEKITKNKTESGKAKKYLGVPYRRAFFSSTDEKEVATHIKKNVKGISEVKLIRKKEPHSGSNSYNSFVIILKNGTVVPLVNVSVGKGGARNKQLVPNRILPLDQDIKLEKLIHLVTTNLEKMSLNSDVKKVCIGLINLAKQKGKDAASPNKGKSDPVIFHEFKDTITIPPEIVKSLLKLSETDINSIGKDFGEIVGAVYLMAKFGGVFSRFPKNSNEPLVDYYIDGNAISAKFKTGAAPAVTTIAEKMDKHVSIMKDDPGEKKLYQIMKIIREESTGNHMVALAKFLNTEMWRAMDSKIKFKTTNYQNEVKEYLNKKLAEFKDPKKLYAFIHKEFYSKTLKNRAGDMNGFIKAARGKEKIDGWILSVCQYDVADVLNENQSIMKAFNAVIKSMDVKQLYITEINPKKAKITFNLKMFKTSNFKFEGGTSATKLIKKIVFRAI